MTTSSSRRSIYWTYYGTEPSKIRAYYGWGTNEYVDSDEFYVNYNKKEFTVQPQDSVIEIGEKSVDINWELNFTPTSLHLYRDTYDVQTLSPTDTSCNINYVSTFKIRAYYGTGKYEYIDSNSFKVTKNYAEFITEPEGGEIPAGESKYLVTWELNFEPDVQEVYIYKKGEYDSEMGDYEYDVVNSYTIDSNARQAEFPANGEDEYYRIVASIGDTYEMSHRFNVTSSVAELVNKSTISSETVNVGDEVSISGAAEGGVSPYTYAFYFKRSANTTWKVIGTEFGTKSSATLTPTAAADFDVKVIVKDSNGTTAEKTFTITAKQAVNTLNNTSVINSDTVQVGDKVRVSASANGGTSPYKYAYYYKRSTNSTWKVLGTEFGTNSSVSFTPTAEADFDVKVVVKDSDGTTTEKLFTVKAVNELELTNVSVISRTNIKLGTAIPMIGKAVGGTSPYTYSFYFKRSTNTNWKLLGDKFGTATTARLKPTATGDYDIRIDVKDSTGTIVKKFFTATVK